MQRTAVALLLVNYKPVQPVSVGESRLESYLATSLVLAAPTFDARVKIPGWCLAPDNRPHGGERPSLRFDCVIISNAVGLPTTSLLAI